MSKSSSEGYFGKLLGQAGSILTGASDAGLQVQLFDVLQEFFDGSNCWLESIPFTVIPNTLEYPLVPLTGRILRLNGVIDQNNVPQQAAMPVIGVVRFLYPYNNTQPMTASVIKNVTDPLACFPPHIPEWVLPAHGIGLLHGILGNMMMQPGFSYTNVTGAPYHLQKFRDAISHARVAALRANTVGSQAWAFPQSFRVRGQRGGVSTTNINPTPLR
jgi:hypothetical protein